MCLGDINIGMSDELSKNIGKHWFPLIIHTGIMKRIASIALFFS